MILIQSLRERVESFKVISQAVSVADGWWRWLVKDVECVLMVDISS